MASTTPPVIFSPRRRLAARRRALVDGYEEMRDFDRLSLRLVEPLRVLRMVHFAAWIARRWEDAAFPRTFCCAATRLCAN